MFCIKKYRALTFLFQFFEKFVEYQFLLLWSFSLILKAHSLLNSEL